MSSSDRSMSGWRTRGLQRITGSNGLLLVVDLRKLSAAADGADLGARVLAGLSPWASAVMVVSTPVTEGWLAAEVVPRNVGLICSADVLSVPAGFDALLVEPDATPDRHETVARIAIHDLSLRDEGRDADPSHHDVVLVVGAEHLNSGALRELDTQLAAPWIGSVACSSFPEAVANGRRLVEAGASGLVVGSVLWADIEGETPLATQEFVDEVRRRVISLVAAMTVAASTWELGELPSVEDLEWFGARSFVYHPDIDRYEERLIVIRADNPDGALEAGSAEVDEYAAANKATALDAIQVSPIRTEHDMPAAHLMEWLEIYSQMHEAESEAAFLSRFLPSE